MRDSLKTILVSVVVVYLAIPAQIAIASFGSLHLRLFPGESTVAIIYGALLYLIITSILTAAMTRLAYRDRTKRNAKEVFVYAMAATLLILGVRFVINLFM